MGTKNNWACIKLFENGAIVPFPRVMVQFNPSLTMVHTISQTISLKRTSNHMLIQAPMISQVQVSDHGTVSGGVLYFRCTPKSPFQILGP